MSRMDWEAEVRWNRLRADRGMNPYRSLLFFRAALIVSAVIILALFAALTLAASRCGG